MSSSPTAGPAISLLCPAWNGGELILQALAGALEQMREDDELLLQDGGSTDGSIEAVQERLGHHPQLKIVSAPDDGQSDALNLALARAENPVVGWLNADDAIFPGALDAVRRAWLSRPDVDLVYGTWTIFDNDGTTLRVGIPHDYTLRGLTFQARLFTGALFFRRDLLRSSGGFDRDLFMCMDLDIVLRWAAMGVVTVQVPETLAGFRWHEDSKTGATDIRVVKEALVVRRRHNRGVSGRVLADVSTLVHLVAFAATPLRRADWYSRLRVRLVSRKNRTA